jgi:sulfatase maturation enzyme AslB (radical SAM superfamily)
MSTLQFEGVTSVTSDMHDLPLDVEVNIDDAEYARIMRRITIADGGTDTDVSAFNSSI